MMKKRHILHWAMGVVMTPLLGSCAADDVVGDAGREGCDIILGQPMTVTSATRSADGRNSSNQFEQDEIVWLWANKSGGSEYIKAWQLTAKSGGSLIGSPQYWPSDGSHLDVYALHGNFENSQIREDATFWSSLTSKATSCRSVPKKFLAAFTVCPPTALRRCWAPSRRSAPARPFRCSSALPAPGCRWA